MYLSELVMLMLNCFSRLVHGDRYAVGLCQRSRLLGVFLQEEKRILEGRIRFESNNFVFLFPNFFRSQEQADQQSSTPPPPVAEGGQK